MRNLVSYKITNNVGLVVTDKTLTVMKFDRYGHLTLLTFTATEAVKVAAAIRSKLGEMDIDTEELESLDNLEFYDRSDF